MHVYVLSSPVRVSYFSFAFDFFKRGLWQKDWSVLAVSAYVTDLALIIL